MMGINPIEYDIFLCSSACYIKTFFRQIDRYLHDIDETWLHMDHKLFKMWAKF